ncbi:heavy metal translocating P-type ATPase [Kingella oralis]|uniref:heavy metal translocating P-type ATPase n=3 Tax=Kingella oralis TaxID=505 RepID=UPI002D7E79DF|nr:heavy metal translocating P-type ATPase [Kingella oralis]
MSTQHINLQIDGMTCQACASRIEKVLNKKDFVANASVNFAGETAQVEYDDAQTTPEELMQIIQKTGYQAALKTSALPEMQPENANLWRSHWRTWLLLILAAPFMLGMVGMLFGSHALTPPAWLQIALASIVQLWLAIPFYKSAIASVRGGLANMDVLVSIGTLAIYLYSIGMMLAGHPVHHVYFEAGVMVIAFVSLGKFLEERTKRGSLNSLGLMMQLTPRQVTVLRGTQWQPEKLENVQIGDTLRAVQGERIAADGVVIAGEAWADESHLTGESQPVYKTAGSKVLAGSILSGSVDYRAEQLGSNTLLGDMMNALADAQGSKAPIARLADKAAAVFVPTVLSIAALTFIATWLFTGSATKALVHAVAVLVVACPCALGLATPAAIMAGMGVAVRHGVWFKNAAAMEQAGHIDTVVLDKTGTLTQGKPDIAAIWTAPNISEDTLFQAAAAVEQHAAHPLAKAIVSHAAERGIAIPTATQPETEAGAGLQAQVAGIGLVKVGKPDFANLDMQAVWQQGQPENGQPENDIWQIASLVAVSINGEAAGAFALADPLKPDSAEAIARLHAHGIGVYILSGDNAATVSHIANALGIDSPHAHGNQSPRSKADFIAQLKAQGRSVAMVGDGINDAPALALADVGFAVRGSTDIAEHSADAVLVRQSVNQLADGIFIARETLKNIKQNLFFAFIYNILGIPLAAFGLLTPVIAGAMMAMSSVSVLGNALRLKKFQAR